MKKKLLRPMPQKGKIDAENQTGGATPHRNFSLKTVIIIMAAFLVVCVGVVVPVCIFCVDIPVNPSFAAFDQDKDYTVSVTWKKIAGAEKYDVEYCFSDPVSDTTSITKGSTQNSRYTVQRQKGTYYFRVRAVKRGRKGKYSDWIKLEIEPLKLSSPSMITIDPSNLQVSWTPVTYRYYNDYSLEVPAYVYSYTWEVEGETGVWTSDKTIATGVTLSSAILTYGLYKNYYQGFATEWPGNATLRIKVAAVNYDYNALGGFSKTVGDSPEEKALHSIYDEVGEYGEASIVITQEIFDALAK